LSFAMLNQKRATGNSMQCNWYDVNASSALIELDRSGDQRENRPVAADSDVLARMPLGSVLPAKDAAGFGELASEQFDSEHLRIRVATVAARALSLFMSHESSALMHTFLTTSGALSLRSESEPIRGQSARCQIDTNHSG
jgi:hypothetical protein